MSGLRRCSDFHPLLSLMGGERQGHLLRGLGSEGIKGLANVSPFSTLNFYLGERCQGQNTHCWLPPLGPESVNSHLETLARRSFPLFRKRPFLKLF